ncbi:MAG: Calx-beta domain-containing protein, partial [Verrucomicrobiales bacterium]
EESEIARLRFYRRTAGVWLAAGEEVVESGDSRLGDLFLGRSTVLALWGSGAQAFSLPFVGATIEDNESPSIRIVDGEAVEGDRSITFEVRSSTILHDGIEIDFVTSDASAIAGVDYVAASGTVRIPPGANAALIRVDLIENSITDSERVFRVVATGSSSGSITGAGADGRIIDDDPRLVSIGSASLHEGDQGLRRMRFPIVLSGAAPADLAIEFWTISGTAIEGQDFSALVGSTVIPAGQTEWFLEVDVIGDAIAEPAEHFYLAARITGEGQGFSVGNSGVGSILDDDSLASRMMLADGPTLIEGDQGLRDAVFPLAIDPPSTSPIDLEFEIFPGSASYAADFLSQGGTVTVPAGETRAEIRIPIVGDRITEAEEQFGILGDGLTGTPGSYLPADELFLSGQIGMYVALDGERLLGASYSVFGGVGQAVVYEREPETHRWVNDALLVPSDGAIGANFGRRLTLDGDTAVIAAPTADLAGIDSGSVYVFEKQGGAWEEAALLTPEDLMAGDRFGRAVSIDGDWMVATADLDDGQGGEAGTAYIYHRVGGTWRLQQEISAGDGEAGDRFGQSASVSGDTIAIGAPYAGGGGAVYLFHRVGLQWAESTRLVPADAADGDVFGWAVSVDGDWIAASARSDSNERGIGAGAVYILNQHSGPGGNTGFVTKLLKPDGAAGANLGYTIELEAGRLLAVPAQGLTSYVFTMTRDDPTRWRVTPIVSGNTDRWGSISGDTVAIGSFRDGDAVVFQQVAAVATIQDDDRSGLPVISIADRSVAEPSGQPLDYSFDIDVIGNVLEPMSVDYRIVSGSALSGTDFESGSGTLEFPLVSSSGAISITVLPDSVPEPNETFYIIFSNPRGGTLSAPWAEVTIAEQRLLEFLPFRSLLHVKIPTGAEGAAWRLPGADLRGWGIGRSGVGYERSSGFESQIVLDVESLMYNRSEAILIRIPFEVEDPDNLESMTLRMKYDDGYAAFLNGVPVASRNAAASLLRASDIHFDSEALVFEDVDLSDHLGDLVAGENILAIHGLNSGATSSDFLIVPSLVADQRLPVEGSFPAWQLRNGIAETSDPGADTDGDRLADLVEYGLGSDPMVPGLAPHFAAAISDPDGLLGLQFTLPSPAPPDVAYEIEVSGDLGSGGWAVVSSKLGNAPWQGVAEVTSVPEAGAEQVLVNVADIVPASIGGRRFMRLRVYLIE